MLENRIEEYLASKVIEAGDYESRHALSEGKLAESVEKLIEQQCRTKHRGWYGVFIQIVTPYLLILLIAFNSIEMGTPTGPLSMLVLLGVLSFPITALFGIQRAVQRQIDDTILETMFHLWRNNTRGPTRADE